MNAVELCEITKTFNGHRAVDALTLSVPPGSIYGFISVFNGFGNALGAWLGGYVYDLTGSYAMAFGVAIVSKAASAGALWIVAPRKVRRVRRSP